jgi:hypothetical protein
MGKKILHLWNTAGIGSILAKYMDRLYGTQSRVIMKKSFDKFGFTTVGELIETDNTLFGKLQFYWKCLRAINGQNLLHIHAFYRMVPIARTFHPFMPIIYHCHGTEVRNKWKQRIKQLKYADAILYHARDLEGEGMPKNVYFINCPVDTDYFNSNGNEIREKNTAFTFSYRADDMAIDYANKHGLKLTLHNYSKSKPISYLELPSLLRKYEYYLDFKRDVDGSFLHKDYEHYTVSKTALEALACGCKVVDPRYKIRQGLPDENKPENVVNELWKIYERNGIMK